MASRARSIRLFRSSTARVTKDSLGCPAILAPPAPDHHLAIGRHELQARGGLHDLPPTLMHQAVVVMAQRDHLAQVGLAALAPEIDVVRFRPADRPVTLRPGARLVASPQASPLRRL